MIKRSFDYSFYHRSFVDKIHLIPTSVPRLKATYHTVNTFKTSSLMTRTMMQTAAMMTEAQFVSAIFLKTSITI